MDKILASVIEFINPVANNDVLSLVKSVLNWMIYIAVPIGVIIIIYAGVILLTSKGQPAKVEQGKKTLTWAVIGIAIIFIGRGFISLIVSIINLAK